MEIFYSKLAKKKFFYPGKKVITFKTNDTKAKYSSDLGFNVIKFPYANDEGNIHFMLLQKYIFIQEYESSTEVNEYQFLYEKDDQLKGNGNEGIFEYGIDF